MIEILNYYDRYYAKMMFHNVMKDKWVLEYFEKYGIENEIHLKIIILIKYFY